MPPAISARPAAARQIPPSAFIKAKFRPLLDRIDIQISVTSWQHAELTQSPDSSASSAIALRVALAFERQLQRQNHSNNLLTTRGIETYCRPDADGAQLLGKAMKHLN